jgi:hypothetical protein
VETVEDGYVQIGDDGDSLTDMDEAVPVKLFCHSDTRCQRNVS